jgi:hypothetical protein
VTDDNVPAWIRSNADEIDPLAPLDDLAPLEAITGDGIAVVGDFVRAGRAAATSSSI